MFGLSKRKELEEKRKELEELRKRLDDLTKLVRKRAGRAKKEIRRFD